jgi:Tfp pilus assembly protein FimT
MPRQIANRGTMKAGLARSERTRSGAVASVSRTSGGRLSAGAFTLVELIFVMVLLIIVASLVAPRMSAFFQGRALSSEAQRFLSLTHYAQSRAVAEGVPVLLWIDASKSSYGLEVQGGHTGADDRGSSFAAEPSIVLEVPLVTDAPVSEQEDEKLGFPENLPAIRFTPDGFFDEASVTRVILRQGTEAALEIVPTANRLGYEIRPSSRAK